MTLAMVWFVWYGMVVVWYHHTIPLTTHTIEVIPNTIPVVVPVWYGSSMVAHLRSSHLN